MSARKQSIFCRITSLDFSVLPRALDLLCVVDGHRWSQAASQGLWWCHKSPWNLAGVLLCSLIQKVRDWPGNTGDG